MLDYIKKIWKPRGKLPITGGKFSESKYKNCDIEFFPHAGRYFPRYKKYYLFWWSTKQAYSLENDMSCCEFADSFEGAVEILDKYIELKSVESKIIELNN